MNRNLCPFPLLRNKDKVLPYSPPFEMVVPSPSVPKAGIRLHAPTPLRGMGDQYYVD